MRPRLGLSAPLSLRAAALLVTLGWALASWGAQPAWAGGGQEGPAIPPLSDRLAHGDGHGPPPCQQGGPEARGVEEPRHSHHGRFADPGKWVPIFEDPAREAWQRPEWVVDRLALRPGMRVADVGAGTGYFSRRFARRVGAGGEVLALDLQPGLLDWGQARAREEGLGWHRVGVVEAEDPGLAQGAWDRVFLCDVLHHVQPREPYLRKLVEALSPDGWLVIVDFFPDRDLPVGPPKEMRLDPSLLKGELEALGLQVEVDAQLPYQYLLIARPVR